MNDKSQLSREFAIIPSVARVLAVLIFLLVQFALLGLLPHYYQGNDLPPRGLMPLISILGGGFLALFILMIGYVNADSKRRGMNSLLWTLLVIFVPKAIGFLAYFLLRKPLLVEGMRACPKCGTGVGHDFRFCPKCGCSFAPVCGNCGRGIQNDFAVCPYCGKPVGAAPIAPAPPPPVVHPG
jgi:RNA polymerase subunit RPABC4/transcription elongation factor Spt4